MKITEIISGDAPSLSFEVFPPKTSDKFESVMGAAAEIAKLKPSYMSVTYGAGGGTSEYTTAICEALNGFGVTALAHLTCVSSKASLKSCARTGSAIFSLCEGTFRRDLTVRVRTTATQAS